MSLIFMSGLLGVSTHSTRVAGVSSARTASRSIISTVLSSTPQGTNSRLARRWVPPYTSFPITMWSPGDRIARSRASSAASPEAKLNPCFPPSSSAMRVSSEVRVGLPPRAYS